jgi:hypothetical protein
MILDTEVRDLFNSGEKHFYFAKTLAKHFLKYPDISPEDAYQVAVEWHKKINPAEDTPIYSN